jgi:hypothetical protein
VVASINPFTPGTRSPPRPPARVTLTQSRAQAGGPAHHPPRRAAPPEREPERERAMDALPEAWSQVRAPVIVPLLRLAVAVCLTMSVLLFLERVYMAVVISGVRLLRLRPDRRYRCDPLPEDDPELGSSAFPVVLVQIPMFNEREVRTPARRRITLQRHAAIAGQAPVAAVLLRIRWVTNNLGCLAVVPRAGGRAFSAGVPAVHRRRVRAVVAGGPAGGAGARRLHGRSD